MPLTSFCGLLTLQVGVAVISAVLFAVASIILIANVFDYQNANEGWPVSLLLLLIFVVLMFIVAFLMFATSYSEKRSLAMGALIVLVILFCYWIILCCFSFVSNPAHVRVVCINRRCPETFWIANLGYRTERDSRYIMHYVKDQPEERTNDPAGRNGEEERKRRSILENKQIKLDSLNKSLGIRDTVVPGSPENKNKKLKINGQSQDVTINDSVPYIKKEIGHKIMPNVTNGSLVAHTPNNKQPTHPNFYFMSNDSNEDKEDDEDDYSRYQIGFPLMGAILIFIINFVFLLFTAFLIWSWASELDWADYYIEDEPVIIYEEY